MTLNTDTDSLLCADVLLCNCSLNPTSVVVSTHQTEVCSAIIARDY